VRDGHGSIVQRVPSTVNTRHEWRSECEDYEFSEQAEIANRPRAVSQLGPPIPTGFVTILKAALAVAIPISVRPVVSESWSGFVRWTFLVRPTESEVVGIHHIERLDPKPPSRASWARRRAPLITHVAPWTLFRT
jgi:hypothetical protein